MAPNLYGCVALPIIFIRREASAKILSQVIYWGSSLRMCRCGTRFASAWLCEGFIEDGEDCSPPDWFGGGWESALEHTLLLKMAPITAAIRAAQNTHLQQLVLNGPLGWLIFCVNLARLWCPDVWSNVSLASLEWLFQMPWTFYVSRVWVHFPL